MSRGSLAPVAAVTGGAGGIGEACVKRLRADGWQVVVLDIDIVQARSVAERHDAIAHHIDLADAGSIEEAASFVEKEVGPCEGLAAVAAHLENPHRPEAQDHAEWEDILKVNLHRYVSHPDIVRKGHAEPRFRVDRDRGIDYRLQFESASGLWPDEGRHNQYVAESRRRLGP